jgi:pimeloyl-ACP methyl ester carboxylesterase
VARIVLVHGAYNELWGPHEIAARWVPALRDGLWHHGADVHPADVAVCFYGDLFRKDPESDGAEAFAAARAGMAEQLQGLAGEGLLDALDQAAGTALLDRTIDMATTMATTPDLRDQVQERLAAAIGPDTAVVVGHSLGSIVSYRALREHPDWSVDTFVTLGSPLGASFTRAAIGVGDEVPAPWPGSVEHWVNVAAVGDKAAAAARLSEAFGDRVEDHLVDNGARAHAPEPYLNAAATGAAVAAALARRADRH